MATTGTEKVTQYLAEAHATELALVRTLQAHIGVTPQGEYRKLLERHLRETQSQAERIEKRLSDLGEGRGILEAGVDAVQGVVGQVLSLSKGPLDLVRGESGEEKLLKNAKDECATEALEIATYDALEALAQAVGDEKTARLAALHRGQEERTLAELREHIPLLTRATVLARAGGQPSYDLGRTGAADALREARDRVQETAGEVRDGVASAAGDAREAVQDTAADVREVGTEAAGEVREGVTEAAGEIREGAEEAAGEVRESVTEAAGDVREGVEEAAGEVREGVQAAAGDAREGVAEAAGDVSEAAAGAAGAARGRGGAAGAADEARVRAADLPIAGYDRMNAGQVVVRLPELSQAQLVTVAAFERRRRKRRSVLERIEALQEEPPFPGYDELDEADVIARVREADEGTLSGVREYEGRHRRRVAVLEAAQQQLSNRS